MDQLPDINWVGFYLAAADKFINLYWVCSKVNLLVCIFYLVKESAVRPLKTKKKLRVPDVHQFPSHVTCDSEANAELVVPIISRTCEPFSLLDIDSKSFNRFSKEDQAGLERIAQTINRFVS